MLKRNNIAFLISSMDVGGAEKSVLTLINELIKFEYNVTLFLLANQGDFLDRLSSKCQVVDLGVKRTVQLPLKLKKAIKKYGVDILVSNFWKLNLCSCIAKFFYRDLTLILYEHSPPSRTSTSPKLLYMILSSILYPIASKIFAVSNYVKHDVQENTFGLKKKIITMYNPVVLSTNNNRIDNEHTECNRLNLIFVGRLEPDKNIGVIIDSLKSIAPFINILRIVGDGSLRSELTKKVKTAGLQKKVIFYGHRNDVASFYDVSDILILSSNLEGLPTVAIEALSHGIGIAATPIPGGLNEILHDGKYGTLSIDKSPNSLAKAILLEATREKSQYSQMAAAKRFRPDVIAKKFISEINKL